MKKHLQWFLIVFLTALISLTLITASGRDDMPENEGEAKAFEPTPLVIENRKTPVIGAYRMAIVVDGDGVEGVGYEGIGFVEMDGDIMRITCTDAVRSRFGDYF